MEIHGKINMKTVCQFNLPCFSIKVSDRLHNFYMLWRQHNFCSDSPFILNNNVNCFSHTLCLHFIRIS